MTGRRKLALAACASILAVTLIVWLRPRAPTYEGRTIEEWFKRYDEMRNKGYYDAVRAIPNSQRQAVAPAETARVENAFTKMGTNAVPYLAGRITQDCTYSRFELWRIKVRWRLPQILKRFVPLPISRGSESSTAADLLSSQIKPPGELLMPLIKPALQSTNAYQRVSALIALRGINSGYDLARPYLVQGFKDPDSQVQRFAAVAIRWFGPHGKWAVTNLLQLASGTTNLDTCEAALHGLNTLGTNSWGALPRLKEMLVQEPDEKRRKLIAHAIDYISGSGPMRNKE
jgi:hypothetical protein